jgi:hypothetical protein
MNKVYLDQAWGIRKPNIKKVPTNPKKLLIKLDGQVRKLLCISKQEFLSFSQNATTSLIYSLFPILNSKNYKVFVSSHEIKWIEDLFSTGKLPIDKTTYPNYAKLENVSFVKKPFKVFDPFTLINNPEKVIGASPCIVILSHVSRVTGETLVSQKLYSAIKRLNKDNIVVIDGCQAVGAIPVKPSSLSDIYLGVSSKFIGAEPHIGFCWIRKNIVQKFTTKPWGINSQTFAREVYSAIEALKKLSINPKRVATVRKAFGSYLKNNSLSIIKGINQTAHIAIIPTNKSLDKPIRYLLDQHFVVSPNTGWSIKEPKITGIRVSLTPKTTDSQIKKLATTLGSMKKSGLL